MKRILHLATQAPGYRSGGELGTLQFSYALSQIGDIVDYIGPRICDDKISKWYTNVTYLDKPLNKLEKFWTILHFQFDRGYLGWKRLHVDFNQYDLIFIEFTKLDYLLRDIRKAGFRGKIIVRAHNVEQDFYLVNFRAKKTPVTFLKYALSAQRERYMLNEADLILAITPYDKERITELYPIKPEKIEVCPVGVNLVNDCRAPHIPSSGKLKGLITGSLWFGPNADATRWFIDNVYPTISDICQLTVAGLHPNEAVKTACEQSGCTLVDSPESMQPYFENTDLVLAPIFEGGGMKVKIAETLSYGLPVITTSHGAIGYAIEDGMNGYIADSAEAFVSAVRDYYAKTSQERAVFCVQAWELYKNNYSLNAIKNTLQQHIARFNF